MNSARLFYKYFHLMYKYQNLILSNPRYFLTRTDGDLDFSFVNLLFKILLLFVCRKS